MTELKQKTVEEKAEVEDAARVDAAAEQRRASVRAGMGWMVMTTLLFVAQDVVTRVLAKSYPIIEVSWARFTVHALLATILVSMRSPQLMVSRRLGMQLMRSTLLLCVALLVTLSLKLLPFVDVYAIVNVTPILVTALSVPMLNEKVGWRRGLGVLGGFAGALLIIGPASSVFHWVILVPLTSAVAHALYQITTRMLKSSDPPMTTFFYTGTVGAVVCTVALPFFWVTPDLVSAGLMLLLGSIGALSHFCMIRAYNAAPAATVAPLGYTTLVWATLCSIFAFGETPMLSTLAGAAIIVMSGLYILYREQVRVR